MSSSLEMMMAMTMTRRRTACSDDVMSLQPACVFLFWLDFSDFGLIVSSTWKQSQQVGTMLCFHVEECFSPISVGFGSVSIIVRFDIVISFQICSVSLLQQNNYVRRQDVD